MTASTTTTIPGAALYASSVSGLPYALTLALIQAEQGPDQFAKTQNAFDVTQTWLNLTGLSSIVSGIWNSVGVAVVSDPSAAIDGWWQGLSQFSNYTTFRLHLVQGVAVSTLVNDLGKAGYAGSDYGGWAANVLKLYQQNGGNPNGSVGDVTIPLPPPGPTPLPPPAPSPDPTVALDPTKLTIARSTDPVFGGLIDAVSNFEASILAIVLTLERFFWIVVGLVIIALGVYVLTRSGEQSNVGA